MDQYDCRQLLDSLSDYVDGTLDNAICAEIDSHLGECSDCRIVVNTLEKTIYLYHSSAERVALPSGVQKRLFSRLDLEDYIGE